MVRLLLNTDCQLQRVYRCKSSTNLVMLRFGEVQIHGLDEVRQPGLLAKGALGYGAFIAL